MDRKFISDTIYEALLAKKEKLVGSLDYKILYQDILADMESNDQVINVSQEKFESEVFKICTRVFADDSMSGDYSDLTDSDPSGEIYAKMEKANLIRVE